MAGKTVDNIDALDILAYDGTRMRVGPTSEEVLEHIIALGGRRGAICEGLRHIDLDRARERPRPAAAPAAKRPE